MRLGVDFGTTRIVVAAVDRGNYPVVTFEDADGVSRDWFPPLVAARGSELVFGWQAWQAQFEPDWTVVRSLKRTLEGAGPASSIEIAGHSWPVLEVLSRMTATFREALASASSLPAGADASWRVMLGVPANANSNQRFLTAEAFRQGGFEVLGVLNEPSAASIEYGHRNRDSKRSESLLVYDLGGGTFDASLVHISDRLHTVVATGGAGDLGGDDFDIALGNAALEMYGVTADSLSEAELHRLYEECRSRKEGLNPNTRRIVVDLGVVREGMPQVAVPANEYYERCRPLIARSVEVTERLLQEHGGEAEVGALYITGGGSELPAVSRILKETFGRRARRSAYMRSATAIGLAIQADHEAGYTLREIFHRHFGVWREIDNGRQVIFDPLFPKGAPVPAPGEPSIAIRRRYVPAHNVGHFRYLECTHATEDLQPDGDITLWDDIHFPFDPALATQDDLRSVTVERTGAVESQLVEESYSVDATGLVEVKISNLTSDYGRTYHLGRWSARPDTIVPARRRRARADHA